MNAVTGNFCLSDFKDGQDVPKRYVLIFLRIHQKSMGFPQKRPDLKALGAVLLTLAAVCAVVGLEFVLDIGSVFLPGGRHIAVHKGFIIIFENGRDRDDLGAAVTVAASCAVCLHTASVKASEPFNHLLFVLRQAAGGVFFGGGDVFPHLAEV